MKSWTEAESLAKSLDKFYRKWRAINGFHQGTLHSLRKFNQTAFYRKDWKERLQAKDSRAEHLDWVLTPQIEQNHVRDTIITQNYSGTFKQEESYCQRKNIIGLTISLFYKKHKRPINTIT